MQVGVCKPMNFWGGWCQISLFGFGFLIFEVLKLHKGMSYLFQMINYCNMLFC
jgi:hypothetical protein